MISVSQTQNVIWVIPEPRFGRSFSVLVQYLFYELHLCTDWGIPIKTEGKRVIMMVNYNGITLFRSIIIKYNLLHGL